jgi:hypothetical protein
MRAPFWAIVALAICSTWTDATSQTTQCASPRRTPATGPTTPSIAPARFNGVAHLADVAVDLFPPPEVSPAPAPSPLPALAPTVPQPGPPANGGTSAFHPPAPQYRDWTCGSL